MQAAYLTQLEVEVEQDWGHLGSQVTASGTRCIGHVPHVGPAAWLHRFYSGCSKEELDAAEASMHRPIPEAWRTALGICNGINLFIACVSLDGVLPGGQLKRSASDPPPFSLEDSNGLQRPRGAALAADDFVIGSRTAGAPRIYLLHPDGSVVAVARDGSEELARWASPAAMITSEYADISRMHDQQGRRIEP